MAGHSLTIAIADWWATATFDGAAPESVELTAQLLGLTVISAAGGVKPLSDKDKRSIRDNALASLKAREHPEITFRSVSVRKAPNGWTLLGDLAIGGTSRQCAVDVAVSESVAGWQIGASASVVQTEHGIKPYSAMLGSLRVSDRVGVQLDVTVPTP